MAAPSSAYTGLSLFTGDCEHGQAILSPDYNTFKTRFYLDEVVGGKEGVVGLVDPTGDNAKMHNLTTRGGKGRIGNMQVLNDGGLNTKGFVDNFTAISTIFTNVEVSYRFKSAYYVDLNCISQFRVWEAGNWGPWTDYPISVLAQNNIETKTSTIPFGFTEDIRQHGVQFRGKASNVEGDYFSETSTVFLKGVTLSVREEYWTTPPTTFYIDTDEIIPATSGEKSTRFFIDEDLTTPYEQVRKFYYEEGKFLNYGYSVPLDYYAVLSLGNDAPGPDPTPETFSYRGFNQFSQSSAEDEVLFNTGSHIGNLYINPLTYKVHKSYTGTVPPFTFGSLADPGYYADGNTVFVTAVIKVESNGDYENLDPINA